MHSKRRETIEVLIIIGIAIILILGISFCAGKIWNAQRNENKLFNNGIHNADSGRWVYKGIQVFEHRTTYTVIISKSVICAPGTSRKAKFVYECNKCDKKLKSDWDMQNDNYGGFMETFFLNIVIGIAMIFDVVILVLAIIILVKILKEMW